MKIEDFYKHFKTDAERNEAVSLNHELRWMYEDIIKDWGALQELRKRLFYKTQAFDTMFKNRAGTFNPVAPIPMVVKNYEEGLFALKNLDGKESKEAIKSIAANFFPEWMWGALKFHEVAFEGWNASAFIFDFIWTVGKGKSKRELCFSISVPNPEVIEESALYNPLEAFKADEIFSLGNQSHKTIVQVNTEFSNNKGCCVEYKWVGSGWMNSDIINAIDKWAKDYLDGKVKEEMG